MRISDWSSDVCSSDLCGVIGQTCPRHRRQYLRPDDPCIPIIDAIELEQRPAHRKRASEMTVLAHESFLQAATLRARIGAQPPVVEIPADKQRREFRNGLGDQCAELIDRSDESRVGTECVSQGISRYTPYH